MPGLKENKLPSSSGGREKSDQGVPTREHNCISGSDGIVGMLDKDLSNGHLKSENNETALSDLEVLAPENQENVENHLATSSAEDIFSDVCSMLGTSTYALSRNTDRLLGGDTRMADLRKQLSLVMTGTYNSVVSTSSTNPHNFKWPSTHGNGAMKSPTFSMADIAVVVPSNISPQEISNDHSYSDLLDDNLLYKGKSMDAESELVKLDREATAFSLQSQSGSDNSMTKGKRNKSYIPKQSPVDKNLKSVNATSGREPPLVTNCQTAEKNDFPVLNKAKSNDSESKEEKLLRDKSDLVYPAISATSTQANLSDRATASVELATDKLSKDNAAGFDDTANVPVAYEQMAGSAHNDVDLDQLRAFADGVFDELELADCNDSSEWQYVGGGRNKQKRRQNQTPRPLPTSNSRQVRHPNTSTFQRKKILPERKPTYSKAPLTTKPRTLNSRTAVRPPMQQQSAEIVKHDSSLRDSTTIVNPPVKPDVLKRAREFQGASVNSSTPSPVQNDNVTSSNTIVQPELQQSSVENTINQSMQQIKSSDSVLDCDNMSGAASNSNEMLTNPTYPNAPLEPSTVDENGNIAVPSSTEQPTEQTSMRAAADNVVAPIPTIPKLEGEELKKQLKHQLEYYFSRENLAQDPYLVSQMDSQQYVSIWTIANFNAIKKLTSDVSLVVEALRDSTLVEVDETGERVRPNQSRCIVILREIPEGVKRSQIAALFDGASPKFSSCEFEGNGSWFVLFATENDAQAAYRHLRENIRMFMGKPIMARIKSKSHHLNTYSFQSLSQSQDSRNANREQQPPAVTAAPPVAQQVTPTQLEYLQPQHLLFCSHPTFPTTAHPGGHGATPPFIARVAAPNQASVPTSGQVSAVAALNTPFNNFVVSPWQPTNIYPDPSGVMTSQFPGPFLQPTYKPGQVHQSHYQTSSANNKPLNSSGHRFTDFHKGVNQRNSYSQRKLSSGQYPQPHHGASAQPISQSRYILTTDPNPPNLMPEMVGHYMQSDQATTHVAHSLPNHHPTHYLPAVPAPFVTPNANDPNLVAIPQPPMGVVAQQGGLHNRNTPRRQPTQPMHHPPNRSQTSHPAHQGNSNAPPSGNRSRYSNSSRSSANYQPEVGPRFFQKGMSQHHPPSYSGGGGAGYGYQNSVAYTQKPPASSGGETLHLSSQDYRLSYNNKPISTYSSIEHQASRPRSPQPSTDKDYNSPDAPRAHGAVDDVFKVTGDSNNNYAKRNNLLRANSNNGQTGPVSTASAPNSDQRNMQQGGLEQRRNSRPRRPRRNEDERSSFSTPPLPMGNPSFSLESNSFPPLPGAPESNTAATEQGTEIRPAAADVVKGLDAAKPPVQEAASVAPPPKKYSEVSSASPVTKNPPQHKPSPATTEAPKVVKKTPEIKPKSSSAVNTQPVADKHPPTTNKKPAHHSKPSSAEKEPSEAARPAQSSRASTAPVSQTTTPPTSKKPTRTAHAPVARKDSKKSAPPTAHKADTANPKSEAVAKSDAGPTKSIVNAKVTTSDAKAKEVPEAEAVHGDEDSTDANDRKPTYAEMLKIKKAAAAAQMNGKALSDSGKSDSGDERKSGDDAPETDAKNPADSKAEPKMPLKRSDGAGEASEKRDGTLNGNPRRNDYDQHRRGSHHRYHRDRNDEFRGNRPRDWNGDRGNGPREYRGRGGGSFRGRHGGYRERDRFYRHNSGRPMHNGQVASER